MMAYNNNDISEVLKPVFVMVFIQIAYAGMNIFYKLAANDGMNLRVLVAYRMLFATAFISPLALIIERRRRPKLTRMILFQSFLSGLFGGLLSQNLYIESLYLTSATYASAMSNLTPTITFIMAILFGMEKSGVGTLSGKAKLIGTVIGIGGAMILTLYKGPEITIWSTHVDLLHHQRGRTQTTVLAPPASLSKSWSHLLGSLSALAGCFSFAIWLIIQTNLSNKYPCHYSSTALMSFMGSIQCVIFAFCMERQSKEWRLSWDIRLYTVAYAGIVTSGVVTVLIAWCAHKKGPVFVTIFQPLSVLLVALAASLVLEEKLHYGSIIGAVFIVCGLYIVLWGKSKEMRKQDQLEPKTISQANLSELMEVVTIDQLTTESPIQEKHQRLGETNNVKQQNKTSNVG